MRKNFFAFSPYFRLTVSFSSFHRLISGIQKNILRQKGSVASLPFLHAEKEAFSGGSHQSTDKNRVHISLFFGYFTFLWIKLERTRTAWYNTCAGCENSSAFPHTRLCTFAVATRSPHGDRNGSVKESITIWES